MLTDEQLAAIEERMSQATPGPWDYIPNEDEDPITWIIHSEVACEKCITGESHSIGSCGMGKSGHDVCDCQGLILSEDDADFIANSRIDVELLLADLKAAREQERELLHALTTRNAELNAAEDMLRALE